MLLCNPLLDGTRLIEDEGRAAVEAGIMRCDDGTAIDLLGMTHHLIDIGQGIGYSQLIAIAPDDTTCKVSAPAHKTYLAQGLNAFIGEEQAIEVLGIGLANHIEIALEPGLIDAGMGE